ncbi:MAG: putative ABC transporter permease [Candidatus Merdivicinus sp.]|jgi:uncharacterized membrane protein
MQTVCEWFLYFVIYSILGWACETVYCSVIQRKLVNRGFLNGPVCPIYGFGAILVIALLQSVSDNLLSLFLSGMVVTTVLEYITSVIMEKLFHMRWWDYSHFRFQINGRVCLLNSLMFGGLSVFMLVVLHPRVIALVDWIPKSWIGWISLGILGIFCADTVVTVRSILILKGKLEEIRRIFAELHEKQEAIMAQLKEELQEKTEGMEALLEKYRLPEGGSFREFLEQQKHKVLEMGLERSHSVRRLIYAFPHLSSTRYSEALDKLKERLKNMRK